MVMEHCQNKKTKSNLLDGDGTLADVVVAGWEVVVHKVGGVLIGSRATRVLKM